MQIALRCGRLRETRERGPFRIFDRGGLRGVVGGRLREFHLEQHVGQLMLDGLERTDLAPELNPQLRIFHRRIEQRLRASHHFVGERDRSLIHRALDSLRAVIQLAEQRRMRAAKIDARELARRIHRFQQASFDANGFRIDREQTQTITTAG